MPGERRSALSMRLTRFILGAGIGEQLGGGEFAADALVRSRVARSGEHAHGRVALALAIEDGGGALPGLGLESRAGQQRVIAQRRYIIAAPLGDQPQVIDRQRRRIRVGDQRGAALLGHGVVAAVDGELRQHPRGAAADLRIGAQALQLRERLVLVTQQQHDLRGHHLAGRHRGGQPRLGGRAAGFTEHRVGARGNRRRGRIAGAGGACRLHVTQRQARVPAFQGERRKRELLIATAQPRVVRSAQHRQRRLGAGALRELLDELGGLVVDHAEQRLEITARVGQLVVPQLGVGERQERFGASRRNLQPALGDGARRRVLPAGESHGGRAPGQFGLPDALQRLLVLLCGGTAVTALQGLFGAAQRHAALGVITARRMRDRQCQARDQRENRNREQGRGSRQAVAKQHDHATIAAP